MANRGIARKRKSTARSPVPRADTEDHALYLYGVSKGRGLKPPKVMSPGIDGVNSVHPIVCGNFLCWVSTIDGNGFAEDLNRNMENLDWLALHGVRHQQVVGEIAASVTMIPARLGTAFSGQPALFKNVEGRRLALKKAFSRIEGSDEWGVKVFGLRQTPPPVLKNVNSGKDYLQAKAQRLRSPEDRDDAALREFAAGLKKIAADSAPAGKMSAAQPDLLWQATFLLPRTRRKQWKRALEQYARRYGDSRRLEVTGPWPPYSFVSDAE